MKALVKKESKPGLWMEDMPVPRIGHNEVLIKIKKTAICGTDLHIYNWDKWSEQTIKVPMIIGHEFSGKIAETGAEVTGFKPGDRVSGEGHLTCGYCRNCRAGQRHLCRNTIGVGVNRDGCFAEYLAIPAVNVFRLPDDISDETGAILDPLGNAVHTALSYDLVGEDVLITGAGPIGIMAAAVARHAGARYVVITDINPHRLELAEKMGVRAAVNPVSGTLDACMKKLGMREGFDVGIEVSGNPRALEDLIRVMNYGGKVALLGIFNGPIAINWNDIIFKGIRLKGIYGRQMFETWYKMVSMLQSGLNVTPVITHRFGVDSFEDGFSAMQSGKSGKVILTWD